MGGEVGFTVLDWVAQGTAGEATGWQRLGRSATPHPPAPALPMLLRRRLTPLGAQAIGAALELGADAGMHYVFCSRHGESHRTLRILQALAADQSPSPADFSLSVHNALVGMLSIARGAQAGHTAITAEADSFAAGLMEALAQLRANPAVPVLLAYYDEAPPPPLAEAAPDATPDALVLALLLGPPDGPGEALAVTMAPEAAPVPQDTLAQAQGVLAFLSSHDLQGHIPGGRLQLDLRRVLA